VEFGGRRAGGVFGMMGWSEGRRGEGRDEGREEGREKR
jgi:hypothetical protein